MTTFSIMALDVAHCVDWVRGFVGREADYFLDAIFQWRADKTFVRTYDVGLGCFKREKNSQDGTCFQRCGRGICSPRRGIAFFDAVYVAHVADVEFLSLGCCRTRYACRPVSSRHARRCGFLERQCRGICLIQRGRRKPVPPVMRRMLFFKHLFVPPLLAKMTHYNFVAFIYSVMLF